MAVPITPLVRLAAHDAPVHAITFSASPGQYLLTGSQDRKVRLFNPRAARLVHTYAAHAHGILDLAVAADNARFASVGGDKTVLLWDVAAGAVLRRLQGHAGRVECVRFGAVQDAVLVSGGFDGGVRVWDLRARGDGCIMVLRGARDAVASVSVGDGVVVAGSVDGRVRSYDVRTGMCDTDVLGREAVGSVCLARDGESYVVSTLDSKVRMMDRRDGKCLQTFAHEGFRNDTSRIRSVLAAKDEVVISGGEDGEVFAWDVLTGKVTARVRHCEGSGKGEKGDVVSAVAWNPAQQQWASAGGDGAVVVWGAAE